MSIMRFCRYKKDYAIEGKHYDGALGISGKAENLSDRGHAILVEKGYESALLRLYGSMTTSIIIHCEELVLFQVEEILNSLQIGKTWSASESEEVIWLFEIDGDDFLDVLRSLPRKGDVRGLATGIDTGILFYRQEEKM